MLRRLTAALLLLSLALWLLSNFLSISCVLPDDDIGEQRKLRATKSAESLLYAHSPVDGIREWFKTHLPAELATTSSSCPSALQGSSSKYYHQAEVVSIAAVGEINLNVTLDRWPAVIEMLGELDPVVPGMDLSAASLSSLLAVSKIKDAPDIFGLLRASVGVSLLSLANQNILEQENSQLVSAVQQLEVAGMRWVGLSGKPHEMVNVNGVRVGLLAFCGVYGQCKDTSGGAPFVPIKYSTKVATAAVTELREHGVDAIIVLIHWGQENSYFPEETALYAARHLSNLGVSLVLGYHPQLPQDHAYFWKTLVIFSPGNLLVPDDSSSLCWERGAGNGWRFRESERCGQVHPRLRHALRTKEQQSRVYKLHLSKEGTVVGQYTTLALVHDHASGMRRPVTLEHTHSKWINVCGDRDYHCLSCRPF